MYKRIAVNDNLLARAMQTTGLSSERAVVEFALETLVCSKAQKEAEAPWVEETEDLDHMLSRLHRYADFSLFATQLGITEA